MKPRNDNFFNAKPPISEGETYTGVIDAVGGKGDGVLRIKGFVVFVPNVAKGDFVKVKITKVLQKVSFGELVEKLEKPPVPQAFVKKEKKPDKEVEKFLTTDGDSEDFGNESAEDEEV